MDLCIHCHSLIQVQGGSQFHILLDGDIISPDLNGRTFDEIDETVADSHSEVGEDGCYCYSHLWKCVATVYSRLSICRIYLALP